MRISIDLNKEEYQELKDLAKECNVTVSDIVSNYLHDLLGSDRSNGSDERLFATQYFQRSWVSWLNK